jgi:hypothetical protein
MASSNVFLTFADGKFAENQPLIFLSSEFTIEDRLGIMMKISVSFANTMRMSISN